MRDLIDHIVPDLPTPDDAVLEEARRATEGPEADRREAHGRFLERIEAFHQLEARAPSRPLDARNRLRIAAFNVERLKNPEAVRALLDDAGVDIALLGEVDVGMARSGNRHTIRELIGASGAGYLYGVEFVELDLGDAQEMRRHAGERNARGFHGNAIVTNLALEDPHVIPLEESGFWFAGVEGAQRRIGGRMAVAARLRITPRPLWIVSLHLESKTDPADRQAQIRALLRALDRLAPDEPCIIGGDFNTKALPRGEGERHLLLEAPERYEPLFADLHVAGFSWKPANLALPTQRPGPEKKPKPPLGKYDWLFVRGVRPENPKTIPAVDKNGQEISDHDMVCVDIVLE